MDTFFDELTMELQMGTKKVTEPTEEVGESEKQVGEVDRDFQKLYNLAMKWRRAAMENEISARFAESSTERKRYALKAAELGKKSDIVMEIFWASLGDAYKLWEYPVLGIRKGWKVVSVNQPDIPLLMNILDDLIRGT